MANIKTTPAQWEKAREYFEAGLLLREISEKTKIAIPNISKRAKADGWSKANEKQTLIQAAVRVAEAKANLGDTALAVHDEIVDSIVSRLERLNRHAITNVEEAMKLRCENQTDHKARADTILKSKETLVGKSPETAIQINNANSSPISTNEFEAAGRKLLAEI
jgi:hypothetical protein